MPFDYIICGEKSEVGRWAEIAEANGIIRCGNGVYSDDCCSTGGCWITDGEVKIDVIQMLNAEEFVGKKFEAAICLTRKPSREQPGFEKSARQLVEIIMSGMDKSSIRCYEPNESNNWVEFG